jgi:hypothetical protein
VEPSPHPRPLSPSRLEESLKAFEALEVRLFCIGRKCLDRGGGELARWAAPLVKINSIFHSLLMLSKLTPNHESILTKLKLDHERTGPDLVKIRPKKLKLGIFMQTLTELSYHQF